MKRIFVSTGFLLAILFSTSMAAAQGRGQSGPKVKPSAGATAKGGGSATHGGPKGTGPRSTAHGTGKAHTAPKPNAGGKHTTTAKVTGSKATSTSSATPDNAAITTKKGRPSVTTADLSPVQQKLQRNSNLASKLEGRLPAGTSVMDAAEGFGSLGKFVSTVNAAYNHDLDFSKLKVAILDEGMNLGQAMKEQRTSLNGTIEAARAERDAAALIKASESTPTAPTTTKAKTRSPKDGRQ